MKNKKILVVGDVILDRFVFGSVSKVSPEAPIPVMSKEIEEFKLGGAGNLAANLKQSGADVDLLSIVSKTNSRGVIADICNGLGIKLIGFEVDQKTSEKTRVIAHGQQIVRIDDEEIINPLHLTQLLQKFQKIATNYSMVVLSDYDKGVVQDPLPFIKRCNALDIPVLVDPKKTDLSIYQGSSLVTPNLVEFTSFQQYKNNLSLEDNISQLQSVFNIDCLIVTLGSQGVIWKFRKGKVKTLKSDAVEVNDVTGAGDTFLAYLAFTYLNSDDIHHSIMIGNKAAGIAVSKIGTYIVSPKEIYGNSSTPKVIFDKNEYKDLEAILEKFRKKNYRIVFTNGCFDILHSGHIDYLYESSRNGDILIVGLNSDNSVRQLKGKSRPINTFAKRAEILSQLKFVNFVVKFDQSTPLNIIKKIKPDIITKGSDYNIEEVVGAKEVIENGGKVKLIKFKFNISSSSLLKRKAELD